MGKNIKIEIQVKPSRTKRKLIGFFFAPQFSAQSLFVKVSNVFLKLSFFIL